MLKRNEGIDIVREIGSVPDYDTALAVFERTMDASNFARIQKIENELAFEIAEKGESYRRIEFYENAQKVIRELFLIFETKHFSLPMI